MSNPKTLVLLGADRVGKSTIVENTRRDLISREVCTRVLHFSGPKPYHHTPIQQYIDPFQDALNEKAQVVICDRGFSEVCFYEKFRRQLDISEEWAKSAESFFAANSSEIRVYLVERPWEWTESLHVLEILDMYPDCTDYFMDAQLKIRRKEHEEYYEYMKDYLRYRSLLRNVQFISPSTKNFSLASVV